MKTIRALVLCVLATLAVPAAAGSFATYHPDQYYFDKAIEAFDRGRLGDTARVLEQSSRYGDKVAQVALALMARDGVGRAADPAEAYAWLDVAAERGYPMFLAEREALWQKLTPGDQARALELAKALHAEHGDAVAKPRLERLLRQGKAQQTGTRTGAGSAKTGVATLDSAARAAFLAAFLGKANPGGTNSSGAAASAAMTAFAGASGAAGATGINANGDYYDDAHWEPALYWYMRDAPFLQGRVTVRALRAAEAPGAVETREE